MSIKVFSFSLLEDPALHPLIRKYPIFNFISLLDARTYCSEVPDPFAHGENNGMNKQTKGMRSYLSLVYIMQD